MLYLYVLVYGAISTANTIRSYDLKKGTQLMSDDIKTDFSADIEAARKKRVEAFKLNINTAAENTDPVPMKAIQTAGLKAPRVQTNIILKLITTIIMTIITLTMKAA